MATAKKRSRTARPQSGTSTRDRHKRVAGPRKPAKALKTAPTTLVKSAPTRRRRRAPALQRGLPPAPRPAARRSPRAATGAPLAAFTTLRPGATGDAVTRLQRRLSERGFKCGAIDGEFGHGTEAAVIAFQMSESLLPDGVAGPRTLTALGLMEDDRLPSSTGELTVQVVSDMCPGAPLGNIKAYLPAVIEAMSELELVDKSMLLMAVATICAETGRFAPLDEYRSRYNTSPNARAPFFDLYDHRRDLGNRGPHDGAAYKGRGFVQLTGRANYEQLGRALGFGELLLREPERANEPLVAARVLARFLKDRELKIKNALLERDFALARRYVNGGRHGLPEFTASFLSGERLLA
jgi:putative chitinase